ncbi:MAG: CDP-alcohol phosphatidyltransferase family protein [Oscillospiraceae bacterium]|nr:CDP-alcohol phosphatidyltransferase family protein [Oscillospiraceae bacterium]
MKAKHIPNILSATRIPLSLALPFITRYPWLFLSVYGAAGLTDVLDGFLARRYKWFSKFGAQLDSIADVIFTFSSIIAAVFAIEGLYIAPYNFICLAVVLLIRAVAAVYTKAKFKRWGFVHSILIRASTIPVYFMMVVIVLSTKLPNPLLFVLLFGNVLAAAEELWMLRIMTEYNMNTKSVYHLKRQLKRAGEME